MEAPPQGGPIVVGSINRGQGGCDDKTTRAPPAQSSGARGTSPPQTLGAPVGREARASLPGGTAFGPIQAAPRQWGLRGGTSFQTTWGEFWPSTSGKSARSADSQLDPTPQSIQNQKKTGPVARTPPPPKQRGRPKPWRGPNAYSIQKGEGGRQFDGCPPERESDDAPPEKSPVLQNGCPRPRIAAVPPFP